MNRVIETPVYLFLGFLESGKTKFIQETLEDKRFDSGEKTLVLICEEGEEEYDPARFKVKNVTLRAIEKDALSTPFLEKIQRETGAERVIVEYNGMWLVDDFFQAMPEGWVVNQIMTFFEASSFLNYNANMRQLVYDKLQYTELVVFNRFREEIDKMALHKIVRAATRRAQIVYEYNIDRAEYDDIVDPLPFDLNPQVGTGELPAPPVGEGDRDRTKRIACGKRFRKNTDLFICRGIQFQRRFPGGTDDRRIRFDKGAGLMVSRELAPAALQPLRQCAVAEEVHTSGRFSDDPPHLFCFQKFVFLFRDLFDADAFEVEDAGFGEMQKESLRIGFAVDRLRGEGKGQGPEGGAAGDAELDAEKSIRLIHPAQIGGDVAGELIADHEGRLVELLRLKAGKTDVELDAGLVDEEAQEGVSERIGSAFRPADSRGPRGEILIHPLRHRSGIGTPGLNMQNAGVTVEIHIDNLRIPRGKKRKIQKKENRKDHHFVHWKQTPFPHGFHQKFLAARIADSRIPATCPSANRTLAPAPL